MKFALISLKNLKVDKHWNLILESFEDVQAYFAATVDLSAHQFLDVWKSMKNGQTVAHHVDQRVHQNSVIGAAQLVAMKAEKTGKVSIQEACEIHDKLLLSKLKTMMTSVLHGIPIRTASKGGYSYYDNSYETFEELPCTEKQMREFLLSYDNIKFDLTISSSIVIIENESILSDELYRKIGSSGLKIKSYEPIFNFKYRTDNWTYEEYFKLFDDGVKNGLHTIIAESTLSLTEQFAGLSKILKKVMQNNPTQKLKVHLLLHADKSDLGKYITDLPENLTINIL